MGTDAERLRAKKADGYLKRVADPRKPTEQEVKDHCRTPCSLPQLVSMLCEGDGEGLGPSEGSRWRKRAEQLLILLLPWRRIRIQADCLGWPRAHVGDDDGDRDTVEGGVLGSS